MRVGLLALACGGCIPAVPFVVGETAEALKPREVSVAIYGGGGAFTGSGSSSSTCCGGVMTRLRVGVGRAQEVGVEGGVYLDGRPGNGNVWGTGKLAWKLQLREHYAIVAGVGGTLLGTTIGLGGDFGVIASTKRLLETPLQLYAGLRATMMVPTSYYGFNGGAVLSGGLMWNVSHRWRLAFEGGVIGAGGYANYDGANQSAGWFGSYGAVAISYAWRR